MTTSTIPSATCDQIMASAKSIVNHIVKTNYQPNFFTDEEIKDIASEAIADATRSIASYNPAKKLENWLWSIAKHCIMDAYEAKINREIISGRMPYYYDEDGNEYSPADNVPASGSYDVATCVECREQLDNADDTAERQFGERDLKIYNLMKQEYTPKEIAQELGCTANAVSIRKYYIVEALNAARDEFDRYGKKLVC